MSKITTTNARTVTVDAKAARAVTAVVKAFAESDAVHVRRTKAIGALVASGLSVRQIVDAVTVATGGNVPSGFSRASVGRYRLVHVAIVREDVAALITTSDAAAAIVAGLYRLAGPNGGAATVSAAADDVAKAKGSAHAVEALQGHVDRFNAAEAKASAAALAGEAADTNRPVAGEAADGGKAPAVEAPKADTKAAKDGDAKANLRGATVGSLIAELTDRYSGTKATVHSDDVEALTALMSRVEALVTAGRIAKPRAKA